MEQKQKALKDLNLLDRFLFSQAADDPDTMRDMLEIILGREVVLKLLPQTEKEQRTHPLNRYVRLDVWAMDEEERIYNTEVQKEDTGNLPKAEPVLPGVNRFQPFKARRSGIPKAESRLHYSYLSL